MFQSSERCSWPAGKSWEDQELSENVIPDHLARQILEEEIGLLFVDVEAEVADRT